MTARKGAYARRASTVVGLPQPQVPAYQPYTGPHWRLYVETSEGLWLHEYKLDERRARARYEYYEWAGWVGEPLVTGNVTVVAGLLRDPVGDDAARWGARPVDPQRPRWRTVTRTQDWMQCSECRAVLWPFRIIASSVRTPLPGYDNDAACRECLVRREAADPRPSWGGEPFQPYRAQWPKWVRKLLDDPSGSHPERSTP